MSNPGCHFDKCFETEESNSTLFTMILVATREKPFGHARWDHVSEHNVLPVQLIEINID
ncbi:uncharacterized protein CLUP02_05784 [Colletotrichum lupini]|uniref:Uncharacterized protein n=1 Tax=Colletotrichum lupini TaxID=145971 RepID=A0A9Q8WEI5_9PEZI|nr:uncharacterized protein CLUP02_05784 [Colletotrichum lupini]UQC80301.1 hypothetical protein CLUP02_05784 [Colletotrichum lupini]